MFWDNFLEQCVIIRKVLKMNKESKKIIFFDGECNLCEYFINYIFSRDKIKQFFYAPLQGPTSKKLLENEDLENLKSIIFLEEGIKFKKSKAIAKIMQLIYPKTTRIFQFLPYSFYNIFYKWIAKKRYNFWGKKSHLYTPTESQKKYFLP